MSYKVENETINKLILSTKENNDNEDLSDPKELQLANTKSKKYLLIFYSRRY